jgi:hypothetical protein
VKMLTIHQPKPGNKDDFCAGVEGEIAVPGMICDHRDYLEVVRAIPARHLWPTRGV